MRLVSAITQDMRFQFRHGFYYAYAVLAAMYILALRILPSSFSYPALTFILFTDIVALGFFFVGAVVILEKGQHITQSLFTTPLRLSEYILSKQFSFLILSVGSTFIIMLGAMLWGKNMVWFIPGVILSATVYTLFGLVVAARARHVNDYFVKALGVGLLMSMPVVGYIGLFDTPVFYVIPTWATLTLLDVLSKDVGLIEKGSALLSLIIWTGIMGAWAWKRLDKHVRHAA